MWPITQTGLSFGGRTGLLSGRNSEHSTGRMVLHGAFDSIHHLKSSVLINSRYNQESCSWRPPRSLSRTPLLIWAVLSS